MGEEGREEGMWVGDVVERGEEMLSLSESGALDEDEDEPEKKDRILE